MQKNKGFSQCRVSADRNTLTDRQPMHGSSVKSNLWRRGGLLVVGVSHHSTSLEVRESLVLSAAAWRDQAYVAMPTVLLSTCNRLEVYAWAGGRGLRSAGQIRRGLAQATNMPLPQLAPHLLYWHGSEAIVHLVRVAAGLDSLVIGEDQILGQVRRAFREALDTGPMPGPMIGIFERALRAARSARAHSPVAKHTSIAAAGVDLALSLPELRQRPRKGLSVLVVGAGVMAKSALAHLDALGMRVTLLNRTLAHADELAHRFGPSVSATDLAALPTFLEQADLVVCGTASRRPVLDRATLRSALGTRPTRPMVVLDLGVPRNVEPAARSEPGARLLDLDDLEQLCPLDRAARAVEEQRLETHVAAEARSIDAWLRVRARAPEIVRLRARRGSPTEGVGPDRDELERPVAGANVRRGRAHGPHRQQAASRADHSLAGRLIHA
jgi:glutamyl-tRNA reductase